MADQPPRHAFRPIAPRTTAEIPSTAQFPEEPRTKRASAACAECKKRRTKCVVDNIDGLCTECALHNRECLIDETEDRRRKASVKKTEDLLEYYRAYVEYFILAIRDGADGDIKNLIGTIKTSGEDENIHAALSQFPHLTPHFNLKIPSESPPTRFKDNKPRKRAYEP
ncbi:hypothetical protein BDW59DRAFT_160472 [Aspergillus cavernicola]|uniref:Zn(2)-C6 fungal-type domain-containing protein n=1 Tax=Aspergillus cavernicola TaxID=176166 RepID=A0ABR4IHD5_9EURO